MHYYFTREHVLSSKLHKLYLKLRFVYNKRDFFFHVIRLYSLGILVQVFLVTPLKPPKKIFYVRLNCYIYCKKLLHWNINVTNSMKQRVTIWNGVRIFLSIVVHPDFGLMCAFTMQILLRFRSSWFRFKSDSVQL